MSELRIGAHVDQEDPVAAALDRKAGLAQFFLGDPQGWKGPEVRYAGGAEALKAAAAAAQLDLYVHSPYVINVATSNNRIRIPSRKLLTQHMTAAAEVGAKALVVHGGHVLKADDPELGFENWVKTFERMELQIPVLIENTAGGDNAMARTFDRLGRLWERLADRCDMDRVGFCLDTCHAHAAGEELLGIVDRVKAITGRIDLVHANDSRDDFGSGADRHANLGAGRIDAEAIVAVVAAAGAPVVVETPNGVEGQAADIELLRGGLAG
ncbi:deoxyribonuclease IV [Motilibacter aurantiacus]|uniref:deoxyribonuclease IV n=1 Tax=Motilibacter aurantiacus TaxID=2714955 RepID=UPI00140B0679|nr:deoxyribonuclease IV [Motilibacter aurantiacus]NHC47367.1 deoxyribonuclease IV [Motilibacter aurantiacus]